MLTRRLVEHAKQVAQLAPVRPAVKAGVRAAVATLLPMALVGPAHAAAGLWMCVGGFNASFADRGGAYQARARGMSAVALACAVSVGVGALAGQEAWVAIPATLLWVTACSYLGVYGATAAFVGNIAASAFVISLALPVTTPREALVRAGALLVGALWAMLLSLLLWPIRSYRPARLAVARTLRAVADYGAAVGAQAPGASAEGWAALIPAHHPALRATLEETRQTLADIRRGRQERGRGEALLVLLQSADLSFAGLIALADLLESLSAAPALTAWREQVARALAELAQAQRELARVAETEGHPAPPAALSPLPEALRAGLPSSLAEVDRARAQHVLRLLGQLRGYAETAREAALGLSSGHLPSPPEAPPGPASEAQRRPLLEPLRENLTGSSMVLRHALRVGVTTAAAVALTRALHQSHGYWVTITVLTIMLPNTGPTFLKGLQRVVGTVVGGVLAALVAAWLHDPRGLMVLSFFTVAASVALIAVNYGLYTIFLTVTFVLLAEVGSGDWSLAGVRIVNTLIGGTLALAGTWLLWERSEHELFPEQLAGALRADATYLHEALAAWRGEPRPAALGEARRALGLAAINAEVSFQRLLSEPRSRRERIEPWMTLMMYTRRLATSITAIAASPPERADARAPEGLAQLEQVATGVLEDVANAVLHDRTPQPLPELPELATPHEPLLQAQLERVARQLRVLHAAAARRAT
ncbi:FUSC family protein [Aggregicoccus sp. 17bor-14]|uniref:FUSC family protein n=1 Tax=Myxococcaceae TaxID=31 RepID=UPI00129C1397|nr:MULTISPECIES: FUSC family protein [Myxococcaceae]MBF5042924.1 FUSC family protein [Simulacricoccus sp. 17bor-14]MRI88691.1 FUSC family protein [Aggregicoccus sp. 17bor-14]